jgi:hypothetical protein
LGLDAWFNISGPTGNRNLMESQDFNYLPLHRKATRPREFKRQEIKNQFMQGKEMIRTSHISTLESDLEIK